MKLLLDEPLSKHTTVHLGGIAKEYVIPENMEELVTISTDRHPSYYIGGGSNLLILGMKYDLVVDLRFFTPK